MKTPRQKIQTIPIDLHCDRLGRFVAGQMARAAPREPKLEEEHLCSDSVFEWLRIAASIESVSVNMLTFGEGVMYCSAAAEYEDRRSDLLSEVLHDQLRFTYVWGAFETLAKIVEPPAVPKSVKPRSSMVDRVAYHLRGTFDLRNCAPWGYNQWLHDLKVSLGPSDRFRIGKHFALTTCAGYSGLAISIVRHIRNQFAHGVVNLPEPEEWTGEKPAALSVLKLSTRLVLLSMQMLLLAEHPDPYWTGENIPDLTDVSLWNDCDWRLLAVLHLQPTKSSELPLFSALNREVEANNDLLSGGDSAVLHLRRRRPG